MPAPRPLALGLDFGTASVRAVVVDASDGEVLGSASTPYARGEGGVIGDPARPEMARQDPRDWVEALGDATAKALVEAERASGGAELRVGGIGVDGTGSTPLPVDEQGRPLCAHDEHSLDPAALAWLWKDHSAHAEAAEITAAAREAGLPALERCGGAYSPEWFWAKVLHAWRHHPSTAEAAWSWVELCDWVPAWLCGLRGGPSTWTRSRCAAGHKALDHPDLGGPPPADFLASLHPGLARLRERLSPQTAPIGEVFGRLDERVAASLDLEPGIPVSVGALDAHLGAVGAGAAPGTLVKILGTSACDCAVAPLGEGVPAIPAIPAIPGIAGAVAESILPGYLGLEAGQSAVGDLFHWFLARIRPGGLGPLEHDRLAKEAAALRPGASGLLALDWHHGNRNILADPELTGLVVGHHLQTTPAELYRALVEATAFGARRILDRLTEYGVPVERITVCGGIPRRNPDLLQIYADILERPLERSGSPETCALGAAMAGAVAGGLHPDFESARRAMVPPPDARFAPRPEAVRVYRRLYALWLRLHDAFGLPGEAGDLSGVMKELIALRRAERGGGTSADTGGDRPF